MPQGLLNGVFISFFDFGLGRIKVLKGIWNNRKVIQFLLLAFPLFLYCAPFHFGKPRPSPYDSRIDEIPSADPTLLDGKIVVIDPGHGKGFDGAIGEGGIREADVNMWVSLYLAEMLRSFGAKVVLTRAGEGSPSPGEGEDVRENLRERVELANYLGADLFLSIHHNSSLDLGERYNAVETYYKMGDEGPSLDAGRAIHEHLIRNLGIGEGFLFPGNYYLLRHSKRPAVIGEASYISNPSMARKLRKTDKLRLEAEAYLLGILDYFSKGRPLIMTPHSPFDTVRTSRPNFNAILTRGRDNSPIDISSISLTVDGRRVGRGQYRFDDGTFRYTATVPLSSGVHHFELTARNLNGNSAIPLRHEMMVILPAEKVELDVSPEIAIPDERNIVQIEANVLDETGNAVVDGKEVVFRVKGPGGGVWVRSTSGGRAALLFDTAGWGKVSVLAECDGARSEKILQVEDSAISQAVIMIRDGRTDKPIADAAITLGGEGKSFTSLTSSNGFATFSIPFEGSFLMRIQSHGYHDYSERIELKKGKLVRIDLGLNPVQGGLLMGRRVVVDADHHQNQEAMVGAYRQSDLNLKVATLLGQLLETAGAEVLMVRQGDIPLSPVSRISMSSESGAELHLILRHRPMKKGLNVHVSHYPGSISGERLAGLMIEEFSHLIDGKVIRLEEASTVMRHTPSPAIAITTRIETDDDSDGADLERVVRLEAYAIYNALLRYFGVVEEDRFALFGTVTDPEGQSVNDALIVLNGTLSLKTGRSGEFEVRLFDGGIHHLQVIAEGYRSEERELLLQAGGPDTIEVVLERE
jgi:N-acetylmuramoyl-L-alanine amidase